MPLHSLVVELELETNTACLQMLPLSQVELIRPGFREAAWSPIEREGRNVSAWPGQLQDLE